MIELVEVEPVSRMPCCSSCTVKVQQLQLLVLLKANLPVP
ncbi:hypothetical protein COLO4_35588 [Corchorus olitorius]|uniref:Uncharacterized protein n=1 Tax=Corchorus olitorius TaxID=93759 RepID=A0A1R3GEY4_9ROSI|nr:hypothetical protein COLO4_35588 [Corchorus olitorius]